jgi:hypothetical protein
MDLMGDELAGSPLFWNRGPVDSVEKCQSTSPQHLLTALSVVENAQTNVLLWLTER